MTFTYSGDPADGDVNQLRFILQDTDPAFPLLTNEELVWLTGAWMPLYDSLTFVASIAAATISRKFTGLVSVSADGVSVNVSELTARYTEMAKALRREYKDSLIGGGPVWNDEQPRRFKVGLHDAIEVGMQDFGDFDAANPFLISDYMAANGVFP